MIQGPFRVHHKLMTDTLQSLLVGHLKIISLMICLFLNKTIQAALSILFLNLADVFAGNYFIILTHCFLDDLKITNLVELVLSHYFLCMLCICDLLSNQLVYIVQIDSEVII